MSVEWSSLAERAIPDVGRLSFQRSTGGQVRYRLENETGSRTLTSHSSIASQVCHRGSGYTHGARAAISELAGRKLILDEDAAAEAMDQLELDIGERLARHTNRGRHVHVLVERWAREGVLDPELEQLESGRAFLRWVEDWAPKAQAGSAELMTCHEELGYAGRLDLVAEVEGVPLLIDVKASTAVRFHERPLRALGEHLKAEMLCLAERACGGTLAGSMLLFLQPDGEYRMCRARVDEDLVRAAVSFYRGLTRFKSTCRTKSFATELDGERVPWADDLPDLC